MQTYTLPRETFNLLLEVFGEQQKAEIFARTMESAIVVIDTKAREGIVEKKEMIKIEVKDELRKELVTRDIFEEAQKSAGKEMAITRELFDAKQKSLEETIKRLSVEMREGFKVVDEKFKVVDERFKGVDEKFKSLEDRIDEKFKSLNFKLNLFLAIALIALTFANPTFVALIQKLF